MTTVVIAPESSIFLSITLVMQGRHPSSIDRQLRQAPIINRDGMGAFLPYLWFGSSRCYMAPQSGLGSPIWPSLGIGMRVQIEVKFGHSSGSSQSW